MCGRPEDKTAGADMLGRGAGSGMARGVHEQAAGTGPLSGQGHLTSSSRQSGLTRVAGGDGEGRELRSVRNVGVIPFYCEKPYKPRG